jgi:transposase
VKQERAEWQENQPALDVSKLVFIDETGANTQMTRPRGRSPKGERCHASVPGGHWTTTTFIAGLRVNEVTAPMTLDGPMDQEAFLVYVRQVLCPALKPGDLVIADNLGSHKSDDVRKAIEAVGASIRYLPPYSPDFNPIEMLFSKLKALLKKAALRTVDALWNEIGKHLDAFSPQECAKYFNAAGYSCMTK